MFTARIHSTYSHHIFTPDVHTGATDRDELPFHRRGGQGKARPPWFDRPEADATREVWWEKGNGRQRASTGSRGRVVLPNSIALPGKSVNFDRVNLDNQYGGNSKLTGFEHGAAPQVRIRRVLNFHHLGC